MLPLEMLHRPEPYAPSPSTWTDPHIARQMLLAHLDVENDAASYRPQRRERIVRHLMDALKLRAGDAILDVGCGPGLYAQEFARLGLAATGVDWSASSIEYAVQAAQDENLAIHYIRQDYTLPFPPMRMHAAVMISDDYGVLPPAQRRVLLQSIHAALRADGVFALDVESAAVWDSIKEESCWYVRESGFYRPHPHLVLERTWLHPAERARTRTIAIVDDAFSVHHIHQTSFSAARIKEELETAGFLVERVLGGLDGSAYTPDGQQIGVIARRVG